MTTIRILNIPDRPCFEAAVYAVSSRYQVLSSSFAVQTGNLYGATLTLRKTEHLKPAIEAVEDLRTGKSALQVDLDFNGFTVLYSPSDPSIDIVTFHGFGGHAFNSWTYDNGRHQVMWLKDFLPEDVPDARILTYGYDSGIVTRTAESMDSIAQNFLASLASLRTDESAGRRPIIIIAYSFGGILAKNALVIAQNRQYHPSIVACTQGIIFLGAPHRGTTIASYAKILANIGSIARTTSTEQLRALTSRSASLHKLGEDFEPLARDGKLKIVSFYETMKTKIGFIKSHLIVDEYSSMIGLTNERKIPLSHCTHQDLSKFSHQSHSSYRLVITELKGIIQTFPRTDLESKDPHIEDSFGGSGELQSSYGSRMSDPSSKGNRSMSASSESGTTRPLNYDVKRLEKFRISDSEGKDAITVPQVLPLDPYFYGREEILQLLRDLLVDSPPQGRHPKAVALSGLGGVGKTQIACRFMDSCRQYYDFIFFLLADTTTKLAQGFVEIARRLRLGDETSLNDQSKAKSLVHRWLQETNRKWLLLFDNADRTDVIRDYWPSQCTGSIICTSRNRTIARNLPTPAQSVEVGPLTLDEGINFLQSATIDQNTHSSESISASRAIAKQFGCLPLALRQVCAFICETRVSMEKLVQLCQQPANETELHSYFDESAAHRYEYTIASVWDNIMANLDINAGTLLNILSLFDPDAIPEAIFTSVSDMEITQKSIKFLENDMTFIKAEASLLKYAIADKNSNKAVSIHRLVQQVRLSKLDTETRDIAFDAALFLLSHCFPRQHLGEHMYKVWPQCVVYLPHVLSIEEAYRRWKPSIQKAEAFVEVLCDCTWYLWEIGQLSESLERLNTAERLCAETTGLSSLEAARIYVVRGNIYAHQNKWKEAGEMYNKGLQIRKDLLPEHDQVLANSYMQMGNFYTSQDRLEEAIIAHTKAINIRKGTYTLAPGQMLISYLNYSRCLLASKRLEDAEIAVRSAQKCEKDIEPQAVLATAALYILGNIRLAKGNLDEALQFHQQALKPRENTLGDHYQTAASYHKIGAIIEAMGKAGAITQYRAAIAILKRTNDQTSSGLKRLARTEFCLARALGQVGSEEQAAEARKAAIKHLQESAASSSEPLPELFNWETLEGVDLLVPFVDR